MRRVAVIAATELLLLVLLMLALPGCSVNPATGKQQLNLVSESQETAMGAQYDREITAELGLYPDVELQAYVQELGMELARESERPHLPWTFRVIDDPVVNAFALPGGYVYITRGILAHLNSEDELVGVLGHEIGHVTARHSVSQLSKRQLVGIGLGVGAAIAPDVAREYGRLAQLGAGLLFLKFGRDDERQADDLGFRYVARTGHAPAAMAEVFDVLGRVSAASESGRVPGWLSTHPAPEDRLMRMNQKLAGLSAEQRDLPWRRDAYLQRLDGLVYGANPREGFFRGRRFLHPELAIQLTFPEGWRLSNQKRAVAAVAPGEDAVVVLTLADQDEVEAAARAFLDRPSFEIGKEWVRPRGLESSFSRLFRFAQGERRVSGAVTFAQDGDRVFQVLSYATPDAWRRERKAAAAATKSLRRVTNASVLEIEPRHLRVSRVQRNTSLRVLAGTSSASVETLSLINDLPPNGEVAGGSLVKVVDGIDPTESGGR